MHAWKKFAALGIGIAVTAGVAGLAPHRLQDKAAQPADAVASAQALAPFVGTWTIDAAWSDGRPLKARNQYSWHLDGKHVRCQTFLPTENGEVQRYDGFMTWHPRKKCLAVYSFAIDGGVAENLIETTDGKVFRIGFAPLNPGDQPQVRQTITFKDADSFQWVVEVRDGEAWNQIMDGVWKKAG